MLLELVTLALTMSVREVPVPDTDTLHTPHPDQGCVEGVSTITLLVYDHVLDVCVTHMT